MDFNPYNILEVYVNNKPIYARPFEFDSDPVNFNTLENAQGRLIRPIKLATVCPDCGQGLVLEPNLFDAPDDWYGSRSYISFNCELCNNDSAEQLADPFFNPIEAGRVSQSELDPLLIGVDELEEVQSTVADRLTQREDAEKATKKQKKTAKKASASSDGKAAKKKKKAKKKASKKAPKKATQPPIEVDDNESSLDLSGKWPPIDD